MMNVLSNQISVHEDYYTNKYGLKAGLVFKKGRTLWLLKLVKFEFYEKPDIYFLF